LYLSQFLNTYFFINFCINRSQIIKKSTSFYWIHQSEQQYNNSKVLFYCTVTYLAFLASRYLIHAVILATMTINPPAVANNAHHGKQTRFYN